jgi:arylsulfatase A-like enzyme/Tfp pilus assembly protein PilF
VLLVTIDTLRVDRVGAFGGPAALTPTLDRLAREGLRLTRAYAAAPLTLPSHASILTGVSPPRHGIRANGLFRLGPELPTLATVLKAAGYRTGAFVGAFVLDARFGLNRGFDIYDDFYGEHHAGDDTEGAERRAEEVVRPAAAWITGRGLAPHSPPSPQPPALSPWFAWVHLYDPHEPYRAPEPYASQHEPYDAEVAYTDAMVGRLLDDLGSARQLDHTLVVIAADHGESLGDHGERSHGVFAYDVTARVPWIVWAGPRVGRRDWDGLSRLIDLAPTVLDLAAIAPPQIEGRSLLPAINGDQPVSPPAYVEAMDANVTRNWAPLTAIVSGHEKFIDLPIPELYDLDADPHEAVNLFGRDGERGRALQALLRMTTAPFAASGAAAERTRLDAEARARLQALGYIGSAAAGAPRVYTDADDPKALIGPANELNRALLLFKQGNATQAMVTVRALIQAHSGFTTAYGVMASMQRDSGDLGGAIATLEQVVQPGVADQSVLVVLAGYLQEAGAAAKSAALLEAVVAQHPDYADAYNSLGVAYSRLGRHDRAQSAFRKVLDLDPTSATAYENLGVDASASGELAAARDDLERALTLDPGLAGAHNALAAVLMRQGRQQDALEHWRKAVQLNPRLYDALYNLGTVLYSARRRDEARPYLERFVAEASPSRYASDIARVRRLLHP